MELCWGRAAVWIVWIDCRVFCEIALEGMYLLEDFKVTMEAALQRGEAFASIEKLHRTLRRKLSKENMPETRCTTYIAKDGVHLRLECLPLLLLSEHPIEQLRLLHRRPMLRPTIGTNMRVLCVVLIVAFIGAVDWATSLATNG